jgi:exopolysaccharide production protein ExoZ
VSVQYLRAFAALAVVAHHTNFAGKVGQAGVDVFFVISGFIMWMVTERERQAVDFLAHRLVRIWPLYAIATVAISVHLDAPALSVVKSLSFIPYTTGAHVWPVLIQGWTLNYETFFYAVFTCVLLLERSKQLAALMAALAGLVAAGLIFRPTGALGVTYTSPLLLEFLAGILIGSMCLGGRLPRAWIGYCLIVASFCGFFASAFFEKAEAWRSIVWGLPAACLVLGCVSLEVGGKIPKIRALALLGDASFSIYLFHSFMMISLLRLFQFLPAPIAVAAILIVTSAVGVIVFVCVEKRVTRFLRPRVTRVFQMARQPTGGPA